MESTEVQGLTGASHGGTSRRHASSKSCCCGGTAKQVLLSVVYFAGMYILGLHIASLGPALLALSEQTGGTLDEMGAVFVVRSIGYLLGSIVGGFFVDRCSGNPLIALAMGLCGAGSLLVPFATNVPALMAFVSTQGIAMGFFDTAANVMLIWTWQDKVGPWMQSLHSFFGLGALTSPLVLRLSMHLNDTPDLAFWCFGTSAVVVCITTLLFKSPTKPKDEGSEKRTGEAHRRAQRAASRRQWCLVLGAAMTLGLYVGAEASYGGYVLTFVVKGPLHLTEAVGQYISSAYWASIAAGRVLAIPVAVWFSASTMLIVSCIGCCASALVMVIFHEHEVSMWIGSIAFGLSMACIFPTVVTLTEGFMRVEGRHASGFVVGASVGEMVVPIIVAVCFTRLGPTSFLYLILLTVVLQLGAFALTMCLGRRVKRGAEADRRRGPGNDSSGDMIELVGAVAVVPPASPGSEPPPFPHSAVPQFDSGPAGDLDAIPGPDHVSMGGAVAVVPPATPSPPPYPGRGRSPEYM